MELTDPEESPRVAAFADALAKRGVEVPLAVRASASLGPMLAETADRGVVRVHGDAELLAQLPDAPAVEWNFHLVGHALLHALDAAFAHGADPAMISVEADDPVHAVRLLVARLRALGRGDLPVVLRHRVDPFAPREHALLCSMSATAPVAGIREKP